MNKKAFTLVELIVVITILAILGTIAFLSFQGYSKSARDSSRITDIGTIKKSLEFFTLSTGYYPEPTEGVDITYSGAMVWTQGTIGDSVIDNLQQLAKNAVDPLTSNQYTYSRLNTKGEFEIAGVFEGDNIVLNNTTHAAGNKQGTAYVSGTYNGAVAKVQTGSDLYILAVPSIVNSDMTETDYINLAADKLVFRGQSNLPDSYKDSNFDTTDTFDSGISPSNIVVYNSGGVLPSSDEEITTLMNNLQSAYSGSNIESESIIATIVNTDTSDTPATAFLGGTIVNESLGGEVAIVVPNSGSENTGPTIPRDGLISEYLFDDNSNLAKDSSGNSANGTNLGASQVTGINNNAIHFEESYIDLGNVNDEILSSSFSISLWVKAFEFGESMISQGDFSAFNENKSIYLAVNNSGNINFIVRGNNGEINTSTITSTQTIDLNKWYHITAVRDFGNNTSLYISGGLVNTSSDGAGAITFGSQRKMGIGIHELGLNNNLNGGSDLDNIRIYNRILNQSEITELSNEKNPEIANLDNCKQILDNGGSTGNGTYTVDPEGNDITLEAYCDMETSGGGWTLVMSANTNMAGWGNSSFPSLSTSYTTNEVRFGTHNAKMSTDKIDAIMNGEMLIMSGDEWAKRTDNSYDWADFIITQNTTVSEIEESNGTIHTNPPTNFANEHCNYSWGEGVGVNFHYCRDWGGGGVCESGWGGINNPEKCGVLVR